MVLDAIPQVEHGRCHLNSEPKQDGISDEIIRKQKKERALPYSREVDNTPVEKKWENAPIIKGIVEKNKAETETGKVGEKKKKKKKAWFD